MRLGLVGYPVTGKEQYLLERTCSGLGSYTHTPTGTADVVMSATYSPICYTSKASVLLSFYLQAAVSLLSLVVKWSQLSGRERDSCLVNDASLVHNGVAFRFSHQ